MLEFITHHFQISLQGLNIGLDIVLILDERSLGLCVIDLLSGVLPFKDDEILRQGDLCRFKSLELIEVRVNNPDQRGNDYCTDDVRG